MGCMMMTTRFLPKDDIIIFSWWRACCSLFPISYLCPLIFFLVNSLVFLSSILSHFLRVAGFPFSFHSCFHIYAFSFWKISVYDDDDDGVKGSRSLHIVVNRPDWVVDEAKKAVIFFLVPFIQPCYLYHEREKEIICTINV